MVAFSTGEITEEEELELDELPKAKVPGAAAIAVERLLLLLDKLLNAEAKLLLKLDEDIIGVACGAAVNPILSLLVLEEVVE